MWTPAFNAVQEEGIIDNILFIVERDFKEALDHFHPTEAALEPDNPRYLRDFQEREWGKISGLVFPALAVGPNRMTSVLSDGGDRLRNAVLFSAWIGVTDDTTRNVGIRAARYANAFEMVLRTAAIPRNKRDFFRNMSTQSFGLVLDEIDHEYGPVGDKNSTFFQGVRINGTITINER